MPQILTSTGTLASEYSQPAASAPDHPAAPEYALWTAVFRATRQDVEQRGLAGAAVGLGVQRDLERAAAHLGLPARVIREMLLGAEQAWQQRAGKLRSQGRRSSRRYREKTQAQVGQDGPRGQHELATIASAASSTASSTDYVTVTCI